MLFIDRYGEAANALACALEGDDKREKLEKEMSADHGKRAVALCSTDAAIHTALYLCDAKDGDYVFVPSFTFYSYVSTISHVGAIPVFLDCDPNTRCVSTSALETAFLWASLQAKPPKAVVVDNAFGSIADFDSISPICKAHDVPVIELAVDAYGGEYKGKPCGGSGDYGVVGFCKQLPGGGAVLLCGEDEHKARKFARLEYSDGENHDYGMDNFTAALDAAQRDSAYKIVKRARANLAALCLKSEAVAPPVLGDAATYALCKAPSPNDLRALGYTVKRPPPVHILPQYRECAFFEHEPGYSVCTSFSDKCLISMDMSVFARNRLARLLGGK